MVLNPEFVFAPFQGFLGAAHTNVLLGLRLVEKLERFPEPTAEELQFTQLSFMARLRPVAESREHFKRWILQGGFEDIHTYFRSTLENLFVFKSMESILEKIEEASAPQRIERFEAEANKKSFPELLKSVNAFFTEPLKHSDKIISINEVRNCFVHRRGVVGRKDVNSPAENALVLHGYRFKMFFQNDELEVPAEIGKPGPMGAALRLGAEDFKIAFRVGAAIDLSLKQVIDILNTCIFFNAALELSLGVGT